MACLEGVRMIKRRAFHSSRFKGVKRRACEPLARALLNARGRMLRAGLLGEAWMAEPSNAGRGMVFRSTFHNGGTLE
jgi:hypothetical protein